MKFFKNLKRYLYANLVWLSRVWGLWGVVLPLVLLFLIVFLPWDLANLVRYSGLALELLGIYTVAIGLKGKRELFNKPGFIEHIKSWWNQRPKWNSVTHVINLSAASFGFSGGSAKISIWHGAQDATVESRLESVEKNLLLIRDELKVIEQDSSTKHTKLATELESERKTREFSVQEIRTRLEDLAARDVSFEALGIYWLFWGLVFSSLPSEISTLLNFFK
jgi:hypothetical protein